MNARLEFVPVRDWPILAWLARCRASSDVVTVFHGSGVETVDGWFAEAAWAGEFDAGDFDQTDVVSGSGGRLRNGELVFVSSGSTVDRLQSLETDDGAWVSNSLACLLSAVGAGIDEASGKYFWLFRTIVGGLQKYKRVFPTSAGDVRLTYFDNLAWDGRTLGLRKKPGTGRDFSSFSRYAGFLDSSMRALGCNAAAPSRRFRYELLSTASSGYDSSTVTTLAKRAGATHVLCFDQARRGVDDSGEGLARCLGLKTIVVERGAWKNVPLPEPPFIASDAHGGDVFYKGAERVLRGKVLLTGYHGDKVWAQHAKSLDEHIVRGDQSGLSATEYRLGVGMIHCPVPFWGVRQIADVHAITNSPDMAPWDVGGDYSRPICRRIVEGEGVPRELFGNAKKATWVLLTTNKQFLAPDSMANYLAWLDARRWQWMRHGRVPPMLNHKVDALEVSLRNALGKAAAAEAGVSVTALKKTGLIRVAWRLGDGPSYLRRFLFPWALEHQRRAYPKPF
jgi:hypothetical protein